MSTFKTEPFKIIIDGVRYRCTLDEEKTEWPTKPEQIPPNHSKLDTHRVAQILECIKIAREINGDWIPNWDDGEVKYCPILSEHDILDYMEMYQARNQADRYRSFVWFPTVAAYEHFKEYFRNIWFEAI